MRTWTLEQLLKVLPSIGECANYLDGLPGSFVRQGDDFVHYKASGESITLRPSYADGWLSISIGEFIEAELEAMFPEDTSAQWWPFPMAGASDKGDPLPAWPKCHKCNKPVDKYTAKRGEDGIITVRSECHGKIHVETFSDGEITGGPICVFAPDC